DRSCGDEHADRAALRSRNGMKFRIHAAFRATDQSPTLPLFYPQAGGRAMGFQIGCINHDRLLASRLGGQGGHDPGEYTHAAPALPPVAEYLWRHVFAGPVTPAQAIAIDEDYAAQPATIIDARLAMALGNERLKPSHLRVRQPE